MQTQTAELPKLTADDKTQLRALVRLVGANDRGAIIAGVLHLGEARGWSHVTVTRALHYAVSAEALEEPEIETPPAPRPRRVALVKTGQGDTEQAYDGHEPFGWNVKAIVLYAVTILAIAGYVAWSTKGGLS